MNKESKFAGVVSAARRREAEEAAPGTASAEPVGVSDNVFDRPLSPRPGRPRAKRSDPDFSQVTAYIPKRLHRAVKVALFSSEEPQEFSELVTALLEEWLQAQQGRK